MSWTMKRLHLIFIALVLWGDTNGFGVWNRTSVVDWQAGHFNTTENQNFQLATRVQPFGLLARKGANGNVGGGNSGSALITSEVQTAQHDSSFVQSSGGPAHGNPIRNTHNQVAPTSQHQEKLTPQSSRIYWFESLKPENYGTLLSQSQSADTTNQAYGSQTQSSYQLNCIKPVSASQTASTSQAQSNYGAETPGPAKWYTILPGQRIASSQVSEIQMQSSPSSTQVSAGQSASTSQAQSVGASTLYQGLTSGRYFTTLDQSIPSSSQAVVSSNQIFGLQNQTSYRPSSTTQVSAGQSASTSQAQSVGASTLYQGLTSGRYFTTLDQSIPSSSQAVVSSNQIFGLQNQTSYRPSSTTQVSAGQSASTSQAQSVGASTLYQGLTSGRYFTTLDQSIPSSSQAVVSSNQIFGLQNQTSYRPSSTTQVSAGQSASTSQAQSVGASTLYQGLTSGRYFTTLDQSIPSSSQAVVSSNQIFGLQNQTSYRPSSTTQVSAGQSASTSQAQSVGASTLYQGLTSGRYFTTLDQSIPSSSQAVVSSNQIFGLQNQTSYRPSSTTQVSAGQSASTSQAQSVGASTLYQGLTSGRYFTTLDQSIPSSSQAVVSSNQIFGLQNQTSYRPSSTTQVSAGQSASTSQAQSVGASTLYQGLTSGRYFTTLDQSIPSSSQAVVSSNQIFGLQNQTSYRPSSTTQVSAGQSASTSQAQSVGASTLYQGLTSGRYFTTLDQSIPSSSQPAIVQNQMSAFQTQSLYQPSTTVQVLPGPSAIAQAQSLGASYPSQTPGRYAIFQGQMNQPSSSAWIPDPVIIPA